MLCEHVKIRFGVFSSSLLVTLTFENPYIHIHAGSNTSPNCVVCGFSLRIHALNGFR